MKPMETKIIDYEWIKKNLDRGCMSFTDEPNCKHCGRAHNYDSWFKTYMTCSCYYEIKHLERLETEKKQERFAFVLKKDKPAENKNKF